MDTLADAIASLCMLSHRLRAEDKALLMPALVLLAEALAEASDESAAPAAHRSRAQTELARLARLEQHLHGMNPGERAAAVRQRMGGMPKSTYYRKRKLVLAD